MFKNTHNQLIHNFASYLDKDLLLRPIQDESTIDAEMKCEGRGSIVTSPVDVMDDQQQRISNPALLPRRWRRGKGAKILK